MDLTSTSDEKEVIDLYQQISLQIQELGFTPTMVKYLAMIGKDTSATEFMKTHSAVILNHWKDLIKVAVEAHDQIFLRVFISGLRKLAPDDIKTEITEFLVSHDHEIEIEFGKKMCGIHTTLPPEEVQEIVEKYNSKRTTMHAVAKEVLGTQLKFKHHAHGD